MMRYAFHPGPIEDLTNEEIGALKQVRNGVRISNAMSQRLELADLIKEGLGGWVLTDEGSYRLSVGK